MKTFVLLAVVNIPSQGDQLGIAVLDATAITRSMLWYAALEWKLFSGLQNHEEFRRCDHYLKRQKQIGRGFVFNYTLPCYVPDVRGLRQMKLLNA